VPTSGSAASATTNAVTIQDFAFKPGSTTVKVGTMVTWTNKDSSAHSVMSDGGAGPLKSAPRVAPGATFSYTFTKAGTYAYHCGIHDYMKGTVVVG